MDALGERYSERHPDAAQLREEDTSILASKSVDIFFHIHAWPFNPFFFVPLPCPFLCRLDIFSPAVQYLFLHAHAPSIENFAVAKRYHLPPLHYAHHGERIRQIYLRGTELLLRVGVAGIDRIASQSFEGKTRSQW